ncbi:MAG: hypothetical protein K2P50_06330 [Lachnospiraceae bacterium]|nr:hypothetical protein [Lachnospiraceae bacterium]
MNTKIMEGLVGARTNMNLTNTPMRVYREARRKGDTAAMERAMGYANDFCGKAEEYKAEADKGMEEDAKKAREDAKLQCEEAVQKRGEEREKLEERIEEDRNAANTDTKEPVIYTKTGETVPLEGTLSLEKGAGISVSV